jgi:hypothetical protein
MRKDRLLQIIEAVEATPDDDFCMGVWAKKNDCGTCGCAIGSFCFRNPDAELKLEKQFKSSIYLHPAFEGLNDFEAVAAFLEIRERQAEYLFDAGLFYGSGDGDPSKSEVLTRLREFAEAH